VGLPTEIVRDQDVNSRSPPRSATWLLERLSAARFEPLLGDLEEQYAEGRSRLWYWRQVAGALALDLERTLRVHGPSFTAAVFAGCVLIWLWDVGGSYAFHPLYQNLPSLSRHPWAAPALMRVAGMQIHGFLGDLLLLSTVWMVTHIHRAHPRAVLVALIAAVSAPYLPSLARLATQPVTGSGSGAPLVPSIMLVIMQGVWILAAGLWVARGPRLTEVNRLTRIVAVLAACVAVLVGLAQSARLVGELPYTLQASHTFFALDIASIASLALLLWRPHSVPRTTGHPPGHSGGGARVEAAKSR
jgi:hypothetical protein